MVEAWRSCGFVSRRNFKGGLFVPAVRFSVDAYVTFAREKPWIEAVASSLTELFSPILISERIEILERLYPWIDSSGLGYFRNRLTQAPRDTDFALKVVLDYCQTREEQQRAVEALQFKWDVLWAQLDGIEKAYPN